MATMILSPEKRYKNGIAMKPPILRRLPNCFGKGLIWYLIYEDGKEISTMLSASGKDSFKKSWIEIKK